jgi:predicted RNA-binding Zn-ribbon protein involved in translation (DUF1610 family)
MFEQGELFPSTMAPPSSSKSLVGLKAQLRQPCPNCGNSIGIIGSSAGPHANRVTCSSCGAFCQWLGQREADFIAGVCAKFGCPSSPIVLRTKKDEGLAP